MKFYLGNRPVDRSSNPGRILGHYQTVEYEVAQN